MTRVVTPPAFLKRVPKSPRGSVEGLSSLAEYVNEEPKKSKINMSPKTAIIRRRIKESKENSQRKKENFSSSFKFLLRKSHINGKFLASPIMLNKEMNEYSLFSKIRYRVKPKNDG